MNTSEARRTPATVALATVLLLCGAWTNPALADPEGTHDKAVAAFEAARTLIDHGDCANAILKLNESLGYEPSIGAHLSLATCYEPNNPLAAWRHLKEAEFLTFTKQDEREAVTRARAAALEPRLALVRILVPSTTPGIAGLEVRLDGAVLDRFYYQGGGIGVEPGRHVVDAMTPQMHFSGSVDAVVGSTAEVRVTPPIPPPLVAKPAQLAHQQAATEAPPAASPSRGRRTLAFVLGGVGVGGVLIGTVTGAVSLHEGNEAKRLCRGPYPGGCAPDPTGNLQSTNTRAYTLANVSDVAFIMGGALLLTGAILYFTAPRGSTPSTSAATRLQVAPTVGAGSASLAVFGRF
jgi:hypothetical protein